MAQTTSSEMIERVLGDLFDSQREDWKKKLSAQEYDQMRHDFVFHMTDWLSDLEQFATWAKHPESLDDSAASALVIGFLYHVIPHLSAAGRFLLGKIDDPFAATPTTSKGD
jgi:hypothetical protein